VVLFAGGLLGLGLSGLEKEVGVFLLRMGQYVFLLLLRFEVRLNHEVLSLAPQQGVLLLEVADEAVLLLGDICLVLLLIPRLRLLSGVKIGEDWDGWGVGVGGGRFQTKLRAS
jgi:hypothetical protein